MISPKGRKRDNSKPNSLREYIDNDSEEDQIIQDCDKLITSGKKYTSSYDQESIGEQAGQRLQIHATANKAALQDSVRKTLEYQSPKPDVMVDQYLDKTVNFLEDSIEPIIRKPFEFSLGIKIFIASIITIIVVLLIFFWPSVARCFTQYERFLRVDQNQGMLTLFGLYLLCECLCFSGTIFSLIAGYVLSQAYHDTGEALLIGTLTIFIASTLMGFISFYVGRAFFKPVKDNENEENPIIKALNVSSQSDRLMLLFLVRMCPFVPLQIVNFITGLSQLEVKDFMLSMIGNIPAAFIYLFIGSSISNLQDYLQIKKDHIHPKDDTGDTTLTVFMCIASLYAIGGLIWTTIITKRHFEYILELEEFKEDEEKNQIHNDFRLDAKQGFKTGGRITM